MKTYDIFAGIDGAKFIKSDKFKDEKSALEFAEKEAIKLYEEQEAKIWQDLLIEAEQNLNLEDFDDLEDWTNNLENWADEALAKDKLIRIKYFVTNDLFSN
jgi:hypothetical protein